MIVGIIVILLTVGLSGCNQSTETKGDTDKVELVNYTVETKAYGLNTGYYKIVKGTVKNIGGTYINTIGIGVYFYDSNNNLLTTKSVYIYSLANSYTKDFEVAYNSFDQYYENVDWNNIKFDFKVS
ncbi:MAG: FxLYD domain-containing protein, partial [Candidatus Thermoplasmatota archaeon]|nr:FxLYD domain-containing protein [Candidatus Thermoplasmatota archaeon]